MQNYIRPCWWGSHLWQTIYFIAASYPDEPSQETIKSAMNFFSSLKVLLPCGGCQESYSKFSCESNTNIDNVENFTSKNNLIAFIFCLRNKVNSKLAHNYLIDLNYFKKKISCMVISDKNIFDGKVCDMIEAPFIYLDLENKVYNYLKLCTKYDYTFTKKLLEISKKFMKEPNFDFNNKIVKFMAKRHKKCRKIMCKIYHNVSEGKYDLVDSFLNHDTNLHNELLYYGCTILHKENLETILNMQIDKCKKKQKQK